MQARDFCTWAGGRLPTSLEWQAAAQAGDPTRISPGSGVSEAGSKGPRRGTGGVGAGAAKLHDADRLVDHGDGGDGGDGSIQTLYFPPAVHSGRTPAPADSETLRAAQNSLGLYDLVGNVWQYTDDEWPQQAQGAVLAPSWRRLGRATARHPARHPACWVCGAASPGSWPRYALGVKPVRAGALLSAQWEAAVRP